MKKCRLFFGYVLPNDFMILLLKLRKYIIVFGGGCVVPYLVYEFLYFILQGVLVQGLSIEKYCRGSHGVGSLK